MNSSRRTLLSTASAAALGGALVVRPALAALLQTPKQAEGPFYPLSLPLDKDNDLVTVAGRDGIAKGEITNVVGRVLDTEGQPLSGVTLEIWQCNAFGRYHHPDDVNDLPIDPNFQGYGQFVTREDGAYRFRTIKPVAYPGRAPHIHFKVQGPGIRPLTTQMYVAGAPENEKDFLLTRVRDAAQRKAIIINLAASPTPGELLGEFNLVVATR